MRKAILSLVLVVSLLLPLMARAQGTLYVSNLGQTPTGSASVGNDSWIAQGFLAGTNSGGYLLDSVQLLMNPATGNPSNFTVQICVGSGDYSDPGAPTNSLGSLAGLDPSAGGVFTYTASGVTLAATTYYYVVATSETPVAQGAYAWSAANSFTKDPNTKWIIDNIYCSSPDGSIWTQHIRQSVFQIAIYAKAVPEPTAPSLLAVGAPLLARLRRLATR